MRDREDIKKLFKKEAEVHFDFSQAPNLIRCKENDTLEAKLFEKEDIARWTKLQNSLLRARKNKKKYNEEYIKSGRVTYDGFFEKRGPLRGNVLDIGGGFGLYRQWWKPAESDVFIAHDPGIETFLDGPRQLHYDYYPKAFIHPMTFVEGFGENLPYKNDVFDTCLIVATLDHCIDPEKVLKEARRCLVPDGTILVIGGNISKSHTLYILKRLLKYSRHPKALLAKICYNLFHQAHHLHHFTPSEMILLLGRVGFSKIRTDVIPAAQIYVFEAIKEPPAIESKCS